MKKSLVLLLIALFISFSCSDEFLDEVPVGELSPDQILDPVNMEGLIISAYAVLNGQFDLASNAYNSPASNWTFGDVVSDDAYKGGGGTGDQNQIHLMEIFNTNPTVRDFERKWIALYEGVKRANLVLQSIDKAEGLGQNTIDQRKAEMRFLRGHFYFELKKIFNKIPYVDATAEGPDDYYVSNEEFTSDQIWQKIADDFQAAYEVLPENQADPGRPTKMAAMAYLCKVHIFQRNWNEAIQAADIVVNSGKYSLMPDFRDLFLPENDNGSEIIFAVQHTINDGSPRNYNGSIGDRLAPPGGPRYPQYGFHRPSQNLINAFKTTNEGLPAHENVDISESDPVDPRLDHSTARPGIPFLDLGVLYEDSWARDLSTYGPYSPKKRIVSANSPGYLTVWPYVNSLNYYVIRYADLILWRAEAAIMTNDLETGRMYINMIRDRARNSQYVQHLDGSGDAANYVIESYGQPFSSQGAAMEALMTERRLELAQEGHRFFDLVRWDIAVEVMNAYFQVEKTRRTHLSNAQFVGGKHEYAPIPQSQIDLGRGLIKQNPGY